MNRISEVNEVNKGQTSLIEGLFAITQGLLLVGLSALAMFTVYLPLSIAVTVIFGLIGSICFLFGIESLRSHLKQ